MIASVVWLVCAVVLATLANSFHPALDSIAHFRLHLIALLALMSLGGWLFGRRRSALAGALVAAVAVAASAPHLPGFGPAGADQADVTTIRIAQFNARFDNRDTARAARFLRAANPDVILLQEATGGPHALATLLADGWPHRARCNQAAIGGAAVLSRLPPAGPDAILCTDDPFFAALRITVAGKALTVVSLHLRWPWPHNQEVHMARLTPALAGLPRPLVLAGDFNAAPWSATLRQTERITGARVVPGYRPTWLTPAAPVSWRPSLGLAIDHLLLSPGMRAIGATRGPHAGSDHLPVVYDIAIELPTP